MILIAGDIHGDFEALQAIISHTRAKIVLQAGDFGYWPKHSLSRLPASGFRNKEDELVAVHFCDGNHEDHKALRSIALQGKTEIAAGVFYQPRGSTLALPDGRTVLFAGGASSVDKDLRIEGESWFPEEQLKKEEVQSFPALKVDIVISHAAPTCITLPPMLIHGKYTDPTREALELVRLKYKPLIWFFGHYHEAFSATVDGCHFAGLSHIDTDSDESRDGAVVLLS